MFSELFDWYLQWLRVPVNNLLFLAVISVIVTLAMSRVCVTPTVSVFLRECSALYGAVFGAATAFFSVLVLGAVVATPAPHSYLVLALIMLALIAGFVVLVVVHRWLVRRMKRMAGDRD